MVTYLTQLHRRSKSETRVKDLNSPFQEGLYIVGTVQFLLIVSCTLTISTLGYVRKLSTLRVTLNSTLDDPLDIHRSTSADIDSLGTMLHFFSYHFSYYRM